MFEFRITNPDYIKRFINNNPNPDDIKELIMCVKEPEKFLDELLLDLANDAEWPLAVHPSLLVDETYEDQMTRARNIVEMIIEQDIFGLSFLDFGCGEGHLALHVTDKGARKAIGFDVKEGISWSKFPHKDNLVLTVDWKKVIDNAPYDCILLYDVLDHIMDQDPKDVLIELSKLLNKDGFMVVRCHPWISKHGSHLYNQINKAFIHLIFNEEKLKEQGYKVTPTRQIVHPMFTYKNWFSKAKLNIVKEDPIKEPVEDFFIKNDLIRAMIQRHFDDSPFDDYRDGNGDLSRVLSFQFVDFILTR
jgi:2-polyprenyl-3-methyl-5-hydroxy-6-metoxy-1,4-benzoquinol methylase